VNRPSVRAHRRSRASVRSLRSVEAAELAFAGRHPEVPTSERSSRRSVRTGANGRSSAETSPRYLTTAAICYPVRRTVKPRGEVRGHTARA
jgi:hypothetical protein